MIRKLVWCSLIFLVISENRCSPTDRDLYAFSTVLEAAQLTRDGKSSGTQVQDSESAETNSHSESYAEDDSREDPPGPEDHVIPYSEHEDPGEVPTRPKYVAPGVWAKPDPKKNIPLDFVPTKSLAQVRGTHTVKVLPQSDAIATATTDEERENAPRLRKVVSNKKTNTIYTEEGYEDSAYDHAGHVRDADFHEGYAKKLHDQRESKTRSGAAKGRRKKSKKKKSRSKNREPTPKEFEEFTDDYSDDHAQSESLEADGSSQRNDVNRIYKDMWKRPDVNPKFVTENEVEKLENDLRKEAEEAEKGSEINAVPDLHRDDDREDTDEKPAASEGESSGTVPSNSEYLPSTRGEHLYTENYEATTTEFETPTPGDSEKYESSTSGYENPTTGAYYLPQGSALQGNYEATTFTYGNSNPQPVINDAPTTMNYGEIFWKYYQSNPYDATSPTSYVQEQTTIQQPVIGQETTPGSYVEQNPVTLAAINGHGPYLVLSENGEVTQNPNQFGFEGFSYYPSATVQNGHQYRNPNAIPNDEYRRTNGHGGNYDAERSFNRFIEGLYNQEFRDQQIPGLSTEPSNIGFYENFAFSGPPTYSPTHGYERGKNRGEKNSNQNGHNYENYHSLPGINQYPQVRKSGESNSRIDENKGSSPLRPKSQGRKEMSFFGYKPNLAYAKMLDYIRSQEYHKYNGEKSESANLKDFTIMKPPAFGESVFSDFTLNSYPNVVDYSSETQESEAGQEANGKKIDSGTNSTNHNGLSLSDIHSDSLILYGDNQKKSFPAVRLLPPAPYSKNNYADENFARRKIPHHKHASSQLNQNHGNGVQNLRPDPELLARYLRERKQPSRYIRSTDEAALSEVEIADAVIAQEINARFKSTSGVPLNLKSRTKRDVTPQELLDASHKIAGDVVDGEINSRFKNKDHDAVEVDDDEEEDDYEDDDEAKRERIVEVDTPDLDYIDEIQDVNEINIPTTTMASIDLQKYPFYKNSKVPSSSPLKYIINPNDVPKKTFGGMEFYDSRDRYIQCDELDPNLDEVLPDEEEPVPNRGPKQNLPRLRGLGDKLDCFKAKYFGENPFDNPIFFEKKITQPTPPAELDPVKFAERILRLPKENKDYFIPAQSKKPETVAIKRIDNDNRSTDTQQSAVSETRNKRRNNANHSRVRESTTEKTERTTKNYRRRRPVTRPQTTTTELPEVNSVTPYQKEVYEDVMGTIKNLASLYEIYGPPDVPPIPQASNTGRILGAPSIRNVNTVNRVPSLNGKREMDFRPSGVTESPGYEEIEGLLPPPEPNKKPMISPYRTNKVSYNTRVRTESPLRNGDKKIVGYFRTVMVHKRSIDGDGGAPSDSSTTSSITETPKRGRRRKTSSTTTAAPVAADADGTENRNQTPKPYYTIRSRSKNSKDENSSSRHGLFTTTERASTTTDSRRKESRYTEIMRRRGQAVGTTTTTPSSQDLEEGGFASAENHKTNGSNVEHVTESGEIYESADSVSRKRKISAKDIEPSASYVESEHVEEDADPENYEEETEESGDKPAKNIRKYDVHEDVQEDTTPSTVGYSSNTKPSEFVNLESYLLTDPPGYSTAFEDGSKPKVQNLNTEAYNDEKESYRDEESKEEQVEEDEEAPRNSSYQEDESDEDSSESPKTSGRYKESSNDSADDSGEEKKNLEKDDGDDMTFFRYESRPESPFESFEDEKYSELGPRINKPAFHHPAFKASNHERNYFADTEEDEKDEADESFEKGKYVFPWAQDEEDEKLEAKERYVEEATEKYEYPWEKRERLAKERKARREERERTEKLLGFDPFNDDDEDEDEKEASSSDKSGRHVYPWDRYDVPSKPYKKKFWAKADLDSDETSSEHRPVTKFSSKYSSGKVRLPFSREPIITAQPKKIRESVLTYLKEADERATEPTVAYETGTLTTSRPEPLTTTPAPSGKTETTNEPTPSGTKSNKRISNSRIIPEDITAAPRQKVKSKVTNVRDRTTLRPSVRTTTEAVKVEKQPIQRTVFRPYVRTTTEAVKVETERTTVRSIVRTTEAAGAKKEQTTTATTTTRRRPTRPRGYKAQESQTASATVLPTSALKTTTTSTTEEPVKPSTKRTVRLVVRKRGKPKTVSNTTEAESVRNRQKLEDVTVGSTEATTTKSRRTRPTIATRLSTIKKRPVNGEVAKKPSRVGAKNAIKDTTYDAYRTPAKSSGNSGDSNIEDSTPTSRTVEHRSRVSKEEIITKTSFPKQDRNYKAYKDTVKKVTPFHDNFDDVPFADPETKKTYSNTLGRGRTPFDETDDYPDKNESVEKMLITTRETPEHVYEKKEVLDKDGNKGMFISITPKNRTIGPSALEDELHLKKTKMEELDDRKEQNPYNFDENETQNAESNEDVGSVSPDDSTMLGHLLHEVPPRSGESYESDEVSTEEYPSSEEYSSEERDGRYSDYNKGSNESAEDDDSEDESTAVNYVKDPNLRLYHYVDLKK